MSAKSEDARLILKLYDLRREAVMRQARSWFAQEFFPKSFEDLSAAFQGDKAPYLRMLGSYWDMAAALVNSGAIDAALFNECNGEHIFYFAKLEPFLPALRQQFGPRVAANLEKLIRSMPDNAKMLDDMRSRIAQMAPRAAAR